MDLASAAAVWPPGGGERVESIGGDLGWGGVLCWNDVRLGAGEAGDLIPWPYMLLLTDPAADTTLSARL